ncbi:MAG TPA: hypothetical protein VEU08_03905, partial [Vicinamibacterales bacterium]|nr:hypothetical protein [Vicinamibacterales bacterium]
MHSRARRFFSARKERTIAMTRIVLAASGLFAIWLDPVGPARFVTETYSLHIAYIAYAISLAFVMWNHDSTGGLPVVTHLLDLVVFSIFQYLTLGPNSPFFVYFIFAIFCAALRWDWRALFGTFAAVLAAYGSIGLVMSQGADFNLNTFLVRTVSRIVTGGLIVYLAQYEIFLRGEIERLARWPAVGGLDSNAAMSRVLAHAASLLEAERALIAWDVAEEPRLNVAVWSRDAGPG